ncbi:hypothetical protein GCM10020219_056050 [Nonomuraea dietziae]
MAVASLAMAAASVAASVFSEVMSGISTILKPGVDGVGRLNQGVEPVPVGAGEGEHVHGEAVESRLDGGLDLLLHVGQLPVAGQDAARDRPVAQQAAVGEVLVALARGGQVVLGVVVVGAALLFSEIGYGVK